MSLFIKPCMGKNTITICRYSAPNNQEGIRRLIGFFSYFRNFLPDLAETARIITDSTQKSVPTKVPWGPSHQRALDKLKHDLSNTVHLHTIDFKEDIGL